MLSGISGYNSQNGMSVTDHYGRNKNISTTGRQAGPAHVPGSQQESAEGKIILKDASGNPIKDIYGKPVSASTVQNQDAMGKPEKNVPGNLLQGVLEKSGKASEVNTVRGREEDDSGNECQTCKNRKYKDGSDEMVSFKSPAHLSPQAAPAAVRAHEQEHVTNAYSKAAQNNGKVLSATVSIHMAVCPECGRSYVAGGTTHTQIKYYNEDNPYQQDLKSADRTRLEGMNLDYAV